MTNTVKQKTIGLNPLEEYLTNRFNSNEDDAQPLLPTTQGRPSSIKKQRVTIHIPIDLIEKVKNAVYWEPGLTLAGFAQEALEQAIEKIEQERGGPFPDRKQKHLRSGRPIK